MTEPSLDGLTESQRSYVEWLKTERAPRRHDRMTTWGTFFSAITLGTVLTAFGWVANQYADYRALGTSVAALNQAGAAVAKAVTDMATRLAVLESEHTGFRRELDTIEGRSPSPRTRPTFSRAEQFVAPADWEREP